MKIPALDCLGTHPSCIDFPSTVICDKKNSREAKRGDFLIRNAIMSWSKNKESVQFG